MAPELTRNYAEALVNVAQNGDDPSALLDELEASWWPTSSWPTAGFASMLSLAGHCRPP